MESTHCVYTLPSVVCTLHVDWFGVCCGTDVQQALVPPSSAVAACQLISLPTVYAMVYHSSAHLSSLCMYMYCLVCVCLCSVLGDCVCAHGYTQLFLELKGAVIHCSVLLCLLCTAYSNSSLRVADNG